MYDLDMYKMIVTDLDETLLNDEKHVSEKDKEAIDSLKNVRFAVASGRGFVSIQEVLKEIGLYDKENTYSISLNGAIITENKGNRIIHCDYMPYEKAEKIFRIGVSLDTCIHVYTPYMTYVWNLTEEERIYVNGRIELTPMESDDISFLKNDRIMKILFVNTDMDYLHRLRKELDLEDEYAITFSANRYLEFNNPGVNKGDGLHKLCEILDIDISQSIAAGDSLNDREILKEAGLSVGVANAVAQIRDVCDVILESDNNHSPMSEIIDRFIRKEDHY